MLSHYPQAPSNIQLKALEPTAAFKKQVVNVLFAIASFFVVYILLILAAIGLAIACFYGAVAVLMFHASFLTLSLAIGLLALGLSVIVFLIKFIFSKTKNEKASRIAVSEIDQPELFAFIKQITIETKTPFPKRIFLSPDVNACVFYNSSFWSMILPIRKNLEIGIGLVNCLNISEFKAVMAHEFGHFSQHSMKLGSFTYNVNKIIYNMLFENTSYTNFLRTWANAGNVISLFALITARIAQGIQYILQEMYKVVNKSYMSLSREMEFHADAVAASVSGGNNLVTALARIEVGASCYQTALEKASTLLQEKKVTANLFSNQLTVFQLLARENKLPIQNGVPVVSANFIEGYSTSRINYKDQWASHPSFSDRKKHLEALDMNVAADETNAWVIFKNASELQLQMTDNLYKQAAIEKEELSVIDQAEIEQLYELDNVSRLLPGNYNGYYDKRFIAIDDWQITELKEAVPTLDFEGIFNEANSNLQLTIDALTKDIATAKAIADKTIDVTSFDFDGQKYATEDALSIVEKLETELQELTSKQQALDKAAFTFFYHLPNNSGIEFLYLDFKKCSLDYQAYIDLCENVLKTISPLYQDNNGIDFITSAIATLKGNYEPKLKHIIRDQVANFEMNEHDSKRINAYLNSNFGYFENKQFRNEQLDELNFVIKTCVNLFYERKFSLYKQLLVKQLEGIGNEL